MGNGSSASHSARGSSLSSPGSKRSEPKGGNIVKGDADPFGNFQWGVHPEVYTKNTKSIEVVCRRVGFTVEEEAYIGGQIFEEKVNELTLFDCGVDDESLLQILSHALGGASIAEGVANTALHRFLPTIILTGNPLTKRSLVPLFSLLRPFEVSVLGVSRTKISDDCLDHLRLHIFDHNPQLRTIWMSGAGLIRTQAFVELCRALPSHPHLRLHSTNCEGLPENMAATLEASRQQSAANFLAKTHAFHLWMAALHAYRGFSLLDRHMIYKARLSFLKALELHPGFWKAAYGIQLTAKMGSSLRERKILACTRLVARLGHQYIKPKVRSREVVWLDDLGENAAVSFAVVAAALVICAMEVDLCNVSDLSAVSVSTTTSSTSSTTETTSSSSTLHTLTDTSTSTSSTPSWLKRQRSATLSSSLPVFNITQRSTQRGSTGGSTPSRRSRGYRYDRGNSNVSE